MNKKKKKKNIEKFGNKAWAEKVEAINDGAEVESVYATDLGNIFMIMNKEEF